MRLRYKSRALRDIEGIHEYISQSDPEAAKRVVRRIETRLDGYRFFLFRRDLA